MLIVLALVPQRRNVHMFFLLLYVNVSFTRWGLLKDSSFNMIYKTNLYPHTS